MSEIEILNTRKYSPNYDNPFHDLKKLSNFGKIQGHVIAHQKLAIGWNFEPPTPYVGGGISKKNIFLLKKLYLKICTKYESWRNMNGILAIGIA